jgi:hypothetical protein
LGTIGVAQLPGKRHSLQELRVLEIHHDHYRDHHHTYHHKVAISNWWGKNAINELVDCDCACGMNGIE